MRQEILAMQAVQGNFFSETKNLAGLAGATDDELLSRLNFLSYGYEARTHKALKDWSKQLIEVIGEQEWSQLGFQFARDQAATEPQIGRIGLDFLNWLKSKPLPEAARYALVRDELFYHSQHSRFDENKAITDPQTLLHELIRLQDSTIINEEQDLVISRDRNQFHLHFLTPSFTKILVKLSGQAMTLSSILTDDINEQDLVEFLVVAIQKKWFQKE